VNDEMPGCLLSSSRSHENESTNTLADSFAGPSATSILYSIGAQRALVGVTKWCADVASVGKLPKLGDCWHMESVDEILRLNLRW